MSRRHDWPERLIAAIAAHDVPFAWGESDCMQLVMDCAAAMTDRHPYPKAKRYKTRAGALRCLARHGFANIVEALSAAYPLVAVSLAQRGDIGIVSMDDDVLASCVCEGVAFVGKAPGCAGLIRVPRSLIVQAFRVN